MISFFSFATKLLWNISRFSYFTQHVTVTNSRKNRTWTQPDFYALTISFQKMAKKVVMFCTKIVLFCPDSVVSRKRDKLQNMDFLCIQFSVCLIFVQFNY